MPIPPNDAFDLLYTALSGYQTSFFDSAFKVTASQLVVIGWVATSDKARDLLRARKSIRVAGAAVLLFTSFLYAVFSLRLYGMADHTAALLDKLRYAPRAYYIHRQLRLDTVCLFIRANAAITLLACYLVLWPPRTPAK
jgi:hypothetical protein